MGKINLFTLLTAVVVQLVVGYFWFGSHLFGDVVTAGGGHAIDFMQMDVVSLLLLILSSYGLTHILDISGGVKDIGGAVKNGLMVGGFGIGFPIIMLLNLMGMSHVLLLVVLTYFVVVVSLINIISLKLKKI